MKICHDMIFLPVTIQKLWQHMCPFTDPVVVPLDSEEDKGEHSEPEKDEDIGITFVAQRGSETPKVQPKSGREGNVRNA